MDRRVFEPADEPTGGQPLASLTAQEPLTAKWCLVVRSRCTAAASVRPKARDVKILSYLPPAHINDPKGEWERGEPSRESRAELHLTAQFGRSGREGEPSRQAFNVESKDRERPFRRSRTPLGGK